MGGPGSGRRGATARSPTTGRFVIEGAVTMTAVGAIDTFDMLGKEQIELQAAIDNTNKEMEEQTRLSRELQASLDDTKDSSNGLLSSQVEQLVVIQSLTSGVNQLTGGFYKAISGAEALGIINEEQARKAQETVRGLELLTGSLEALLAVELLLVAFTKKGLIQTLGLQGLGFKGIAVAAGSAAASVGMFVLAIAGIVILAAAIVILFVKLNEKFDIVGKSIGVLNAGVFTLVDLFSQAKDAGDGVVSVLTDIGDAVLDNPLTKSIAKAGGAIL
tara:strand:- start:8 stop:829 length:822 start_codon:yes stop_codon:yes gene_type:complete